jgi:hypothetical protein
MDKGLVATMVCMVSVLWGQGNGVCMVEVRRVRDGAWVGREEMVDVLRVVVVRHNDVVISYGLAVMKKRMRR